MKLERRRVRERLRSGRNKRSLRALQEAADIVAAARPERYCEATYRWWHWYFETREAIVAIVQTWGRP